MIVKKNDIFVVGIEDISDDGSGIGKLDGYIWFIKDTVIGDVVEAKAMKVKKSYGFARLLNILTPSVNRIEPACPVARQCGGCQLQAMNYEEQLKLKENMVYNHLTRIGKLENLKRVPVKVSHEKSVVQSASNILSEDVIRADNDVIEFFSIIGMDNPWRYRNKAQFPFGMDKEGNIVTGFFAGRTHKIISNDDCLLGIEENQEILSSIKDFMIQYHIKPYDEEQHQGVLRHVLIRKGFHTGQIMVCLVINGDNMASVEKLIEELIKIKGMTSISLNINKEKTNVIMGKETVPLYGSGYITDLIGNVKYQISPVSFYQVNPIQTEKLYQTALDYAGLTGNEVVWDLYCGIGTISLFLAQKAKWVFGVEIVSQAIEDARRNAELNGLSNIEFFVGKAEEVLPQKYEENQIHANVIVVDPPRKGCDERCLDTIVKMNPEKVVYVSCDSSTLARDLRYLCDRGYEVRKVRCCDMFGWTVHVESIVLLSKLKSNKLKHINVELEMDELDLTAAESKATYEEIKEYVLKQSGLKVSNLYIAQIKEKCGIIERRNYNLPKSENSRKPKCPPEKEMAIRKALEHFGMI